MRRDPNLTYSRHMPLQGLATQVRDGGKGKCDTTNLNMPELAETRFEAKSGIGAGRGTGRACTSKMETIWNIMIKSWKRFLKSSAICILSGGDEWKHMLLIHSENYTIQLCCKFMLEHLRHWQPLSPTPIVTWWHEAFPSWGPNSRKALRLQIWNGRVLHLIRTHISIKATFLSSKTPNHDTKSDGWITTACELIPFLACTIGGILNRTWFDDLMRNTTTIRIGPRLYSSVIDISMERSQFYILIYIYVWYMLLTGEWNSSVQSTMMLIKKLQDFVVWVTRHHWSTWQTWQTW